MIAHHEVVHRHEVPHRQGRGEERAGHEWVGEHPAHRPYRGRAGEPVRQPGGQSRDEEWREHQREQQVLHHVDAEQVVVAQVVDRPVERHQQHDHRRREAGDLPSRSRRVPVAPAPRTDAPRVQPDQERCPRDHGGMERPGRLEGSHRPAAIIGYRYRKRQGRTEVRPDQRSPPERHHPDFANAMWYAMRMASDTMMTAAMISGNTNRPLNSRGSCLRCM